jgi:hypothetical protein
MRYRVAPRLAGTPDNLCPDFCFYFYKVNTVFELMSAFDFQNNQDREQVQVH